MKSNIIIEDMNFILQSKLPWQRFKGKSILVSGGNGFLASYIIYVLLYLNEKRDYKIKIFALVRNEKSAVEKYCFMLQRKEIQLIVQDVCEPIKIEERFDFVFHAASQASPKYYKIDPVGTLKANVLGTYNLLELAKKSQSEGFIYFSSGDVYGEVSCEKIPTRETDYGILDPLVLRSCYGESKRMGENMCVAWFRQYHVPAIVVRFSHTYGPSMRLDDGRVFADFVKNVVRYQDIEMKSDGLATRSFCYVADAILGVFTALFFGDAGEAYNIGTKQETSIKDLANLLIQLFPERKLAVICKPRGENDNYYISSQQRGCLEVSKLEALGWSPYFSLEAGFKRTVLSFI
jgi:UDP-glucuronate decarboxylase